MTICDHEIKQSEIVGIGPLVMKRSNDRPMLHNSTQFNFYLHLCNYSILIESDWYDLEKNVDKEGKNWEALEKFKEEYNEAKIIIMEDLYDAGEPMSTRLLDLRFQVARMICEQPATAAQIEAAGFTLHTLREAAEKIKSPYLITEAIGVLVDSNNYHVFVYADRFEARIPHGKISGKTFGDVVTKLNEVYPERLQR